MCPRRLDQALEPFAFQQPDLTPGLFDPPPPLEFRQGPGDDFPCCPQFRSKGRMGGVHNTVFTRQFQQARCQPDIHALKDDIVNQGEQVGDPAGIGGEYELSEDTGFRNQIVKSGFPS